MPKTSCTCLEKVICCHILAVQYFNGAEIDKRFNLPSLSQVILANNDQQKTRRKMRGHEKNSKPTRLLNEEEVITEPESDGAVPEEEQMFKSLAFLKQFLKAEANFDQHIFSQTDLRDEINIDLDDKFIAPHFQLNELKNYFDEFSWVFVQKCFEKKIANSTCQDCNLLCHEYSIQCDLCEKWFHSKCQKCTSYQKSGKAKKYFSTYCKEKPTIQKRNKN